MAITNSSRFLRSSSRRALPSSRSEAPKPYACAVSKMFTPSSRARRMAALAASSANTPQSPPSCQVPKAIRETGSLVLPSVVVRIVILQ
nr:hypothetical protein [Streptomyces sp. 3213.3]